ncbi:hypothetical protein SAMN04489798_2208 [Pseudomonas arsenicoxydans]|uniref:Uncharacterized protein n=1 Tax=Pseudomonas arsenicoxydans TaxID=702115 RepID=A0A1H0HBA9_9PSED|nr:hypothetical protein SAMN04489798_2208 [Pseudomonas arsenicoxydans]
MSSTLTAVVEDGKQSKKIERNTRKSGFVAILLFEMTMIVWMVARGLSDAQSQTSADGACQCSYS